MQINSIQDSSIARLSSRLRYGFSNRPLQHRVRPEFSENDRLLLGLLYWPVNFLTALIVFGINISFGRKQSPEEPRSIQAKVGTPWINSVKNEIAR